MLIRISILISLSLFFFAPLHAAKSSFKGQNQFKKLTVGPYDNYQGERDLSGNLYFTRKANLVTYLFRQDAKGNEKRILDGVANAKDPRISPNGKRLVFTYYKFDAKGDICLLDLPIDDKQEPTCITPKQTKNSHPIWVSNDEILYISSKIGLHQNELVHHHLKTNTTKIWAQGDISSPAVSHDGQKLLISKYDEISRARKIFLANVNRPDDLKPVTIDLPGLTGFMRFSPDDQLVYFSHYLSDTNFDQVIDANDHSVIFRIPFSVLAAGAKSNQAVFPEQISSVESNCNFPAPLSDSLLLTCAYGGSLDVYEINREGNIPASWNEADLEQAHASARSYEERLLMINALRYRTKKEKDPQLIERLLSNHLQIGETTAALFYTQSLIKSKESDADFYRILHLYIEALEAKKREPIGRISLKFRERINAIEEEIKRINLASPIKDIALSYCQFYLNEIQGPKAQMVKVSKATTMRPLERYLSFELLAELNDHKGSADLLPFYVQAVLDPALSLESRLYYEHKFLAELETLYGKDVKKRAEHLANIEKGLEPDALELKTLLEFEHKIFVLAATSDKKEEEKAYQELSKMMTQNRDKYFLRRSQYLRIISNLHTFDKLNYLEKIASIWLNHTKTSDTEFAYAAAQYNYATLDKAYAELGAKHYEEAAQVFLMGVRQTDDLESHFGLVDMRVERLKDLKKLQIEYDQLVSQKIVENSAVFAKILVDLIQMEIDPKLMTAKKVNSLLGSVEDLGPVGTNHAVYYQVLGFLYYKKIELEKSRYKYDKEAFKMAHRNYIIALDLGRDNIRIKVATLKLLAQLHTLTENYDIATYYYVERSKLPFLNDEEEKVFRWSFARVMYYSHRNKESLEEIEKGLALTKNGADALMFKEKAAFYALYAEDYKKADAYYRAVLADKNFLANRLNTAKAQLGHGFSLIKLNKFSDAKKTLLQAVSSAKELKLLPFTNQRLVNFNPERIMIVAYGLIAQHDPDIDQAVSHEQRRIDILKAMEGKYDTFTTTESAWRGQLANDYNQLALLYEKKKDLASMSDAFLNAIKTTKSLGEIDTFHYRTVLNTLVSGVSHRGVYSAQAKKDLEANFQSMIKAFDEIYKIGVADLYKRSKLVIFWAAFSGDIKLKGDLSTLAGGDILAKIKEEVPAKYEELVQFHKNLAKAI